MNQRKVFLKIARHRIRNLNSLLDKAVKAENLEIKSEVESLLKDQNTQRDDLKEERINLLSDLIKCPLCDFYMDQITSTHINVHNLSMDIFREQFSSQELFSDFNKKICFL